jgi:hypothetical protein
MPDNLRFKVYAAQSWITGEPKWTSTRDAAGFIRWIERDRRFIERHPDHKPVRIFRLKDRAGDEAYYRSSTHGVYLPYWAQNGVTLVHELTHSVVRERPAHGAKFVRELHWMVSTFLSARQAEELAIGLEENGIRALHWDDAGRPVQRDSTVV